MATSSPTSYYMFSPDTAKYKFNVPNDSEKIDWVRKTLSGFMIIPRWSGSGTTICLFDDKSYMMYLLKWE